MRPDLAPTCCLDFEPTAARALEWLPLAVRFKLDQWQLKLTLRQWQSMDLETRALWVASPAGDEFRRIATMAGAQALSAPVTPIAVDDASIAAVALRVSETDAQVWLQRATPFAHYALAKRAQLQPTPT